MGAIFQTAVRGEGGEFWVEEGEAFEVLLVDGFHYVRVGGSEHRRSCSEELVEVFTFFSALMKKRKKEGRASKIKRIRAGLKTDRIHIKLPPEEVTR